jgi:PAS domain S-box-containing protein
MANKNQKKVSNQELVLSRNAEKIERLEAELKDIKSKFNEAESIARFGFWELDPVTLDRTWTDGLYKIVGYDPGSDQLKHYYDNQKIIHPEDWDRFYKASQTVIKTGKDVELDVRIIKPEGSVCIVHIIAHPKKDEQGTITGVRGTAQDITNLKEIENRLKESEAFYKTLFENTGTASIIVDEDNTILMANTKFEKLSGYSKEDVEGKISWKDMVPPENLDIMEKYHQMRIKGIESPPEHYEAQLVNKEGNIKIILINVAMIPGTTRSIASLIDLTEIKKAENILQTTLKRFYTILNNMRASVLLVTEKNMIEFANQAFCDYFSLMESPEELIGLTASEMIKKINSAYQYPDEELKRIQEIINLWQPVIGEEIYMKGGKTCLRDFVPIFVGEKRYGRLWLHLDITKRKKMEKELADSERRYRYMVEKSTAGMFILDEKGVIKYLNEHMAQMLDYTKNEMLDRPIKSFIGEEEEFYKSGKHVESQIERYDWFKLLDKKGNIFWSNLTVTPIFNSKKEYTGLLGIVNDINMQKGLEETFLEREEIFTDIIYDMMELLNNIAQEKNKSESNKESAFPKNGDN